MLAIYNGHSEGGGVYKITNTVNKRIYIGSTKCFRKRFHGHLNSLLAACHANTFLLNDFNKCGTGAFIFEVIEVVIGGSRESLILSEQKYIDEYYDEQKQCYNLAKEAVGSRYGSRNKKEINRETDKRCQSPSLEIKEKRAKASKAKLDNRTPEAIQKAREHALNGLWKDHSANVWLVNGSTGEEVHVTTSLRAFAEANGLSYKSLHLLRHGKTKSCGGWYMKGNPPIYQSQKGEKRQPLSAEHRAKIANKMKGDRFLGMKLLSPDGIKISLPDNVKQFCRDNNLYYSTFLKMIKKECSSCNKWKITI